MMSENKCHQNCMNCELHQMKNWYDLNQNGSSGADENSKEIIMEIKVLVFT